MSSHYNICLGNASMTIGSDLGYITGGVILTVASEMYYVKPEGVNAPVLARNTGQTYEMKTTLLEPTMANMQIAFDWQNSSASASGGSSRLDFGNENMIPTERTISIYGYVPGSGLYTRTIYADQAVAVPGADVTATDTAETSIPVTFHLLYNETNSRCGYMDDAVS